MKKKKLAELAVRLYGNIDQYSTIVITNFF